MNLSARTILGDALRDLRRTWLQLAVADLMARVLGLVVLTPLVGLLLKIFLVTTATGVVTDAALVTFLLHPTGLLALLVVASVSLAILFAETGQLMVIGLGGIEDRDVSWTAALRHTYGRSKALLEFAGLAVPRLLLIALPFLALIGALSAVLLQTYDINYYLTKKPPVFVGVVGLSGFLLIVMSGWILLRVAQWLLVLPMVLFEGRSGRQALEASARVTAVHRRQLAAWLLAWWLGVALLFMAVTFVVGQLGHLLVPRQATNTVGLLLGLTALLTIGGLANLAVSVFTTTLFPLCVVRVYRALGGPGTLSPDIAPQGSLGPRPTWGIPGQPMVWAAGATALAVAALAYFALRQWDETDDTLIIAHRGGAAVAPENTLAAFERGIDDGADWLELDVQEDADGQVVVAHDRDFMRVAGSKLEVWKSTRPDRADLDIGSFFDPRFSDQRVPTLREVLELAKGRVGLFIELKYYGRQRELERKVIQLVEETGMTPNVVIMSLDYAGLRKAAALRPEWTCGLLNAVAVGDLTRLEVDFLALTAKAASRSMTRRAHQRGQQVYVWTVNDPIQMSVMISRGVDGIITDQVALARQVLEVRETLTPLGRFLFWLAGEAGLLPGLEATSTPEDA